MLGFSSLYSSSRYEIILLWIFEIFASLISLSLSYEVVPNIKLTSTSTRCPLSFSLDDFVDHWSVFDDYFPYLVHDKERVTEYHYIIYLVRLKNDRSLEKNICFNLIIGCDTYPHNKITSIFPSGSKGKPPSLAISQVSNTY